MFLNIASGAFVRLTGSGLGCPDWPGCNGRPVPPLDYHPAIEFSNRMIALSGILAALLTYLSARKVGDRTARRLSGGVALLTFGQIPLGAVTVLFDLHPLLVMSHFLVADRGHRARRGAATRASRRGAATPPPRRAGLARARQRARGLRADRERRVLDRRRARTPAARTSAAWATCSTRPTCTCASRRPTSSSPALLLLVLQFGPWRPDRWRGLALALLVLLPLQAAIGEYQWHNQLPWGVVLAHVSVAAAAWIACVCLATRVVARRA